MSTIIELRKQLRRKKLLDYLESANRNNLQAHTHQLTALKEAVADLDDTAQDVAGIRFLDVQLSFRNTLGLKMRELERILTAEAGRAGILKRRVEDAENILRKLETGILNKVDTEQLLDQLTHTQNSSSPASHKPT